MGLPALLLLCISLLLFTPCDAAKPTAQSSPSSKEKHVNTSVTAAPSSQQSSGKVKTQLPTLSTNSHVNASTGLAPQATDVPVVKASNAPYVLHDSLMVRSDLPIKSGSGLFFTFNTTANKPIYISLSLCDGPRIPAYNTSNSTLLDDLHMNENEARQATLVSMYVSDKWSIPRPGPESDLSQSMIGFAQGGWTEVMLAKGSKNGVWIGVYPPRDARGMDGTYRFQLSASTNCASLD